jgi:CHAT domain
MTEVISRVGSGASAGMGREPRPEPARRALDTAVPMDAIGSPEQTTRPAAGPLPAALPEATALLRVHRCESGGKDRFELELQSDHELHRTGSPQDMSSQGRPDIALADVILRGSLRESIGALHTWSVNKLALRQWLTALRRRHGRRLRLIIWDETNFQIPWELFYHETSDPSDHGWLGADIEVIRWTQVFTETPPDWLSDNGGACQGPLLAYIDPQFPDPRPLLDQYPSEACDSLRDLLGRLDDARRDVGMVLVWGHGRPGAHGGEATLAGMPLDRLHFFRMPALLASRTLVLLNACGSGQLLNDDRLGETATRSFAEVFLRRGARGVIATSGEVDKLESYDFAVRLLSDAEAADLNVPASLRNYRAELAADLPRDPAADATDEQLQAFFNGFMYLYFGNPNTFLRMRPKGGAA